MTDRQPTLALVDVALDDAPPTLEELTEALRDPRPLSQQPIIQRLKHAGQIHAEALASVRAPRVRGSFTVIEGGGEDAA